jgi:UDP-galactopyranose mutase
MPINLDTVNRLYGLSLSEHEVEGWMAARAERVPEIRTSEDVVVSKVGRELYELFFQGYTRKQWALDPSELDKSVTSRVPTRTNRDDRYFTDAFQAMPLHGYTRMFERILAHPNITVRTGVDYGQVRRSVPHRRVVWTGPVDEYFDFRFGKLPYRSLRFEHRTLERERFQPVGTVNYPAEGVPYTRVSEYKHITGQSHPSPASPTSSRAPRATPTTRSPARRTRRSTSATRRWRTRRPTCGSSGGWPPTATTTWTRSSAGPGDLQPHRRRPAAARRQRRGGTAAGGHGGLRADRCRPPGASPPNG